MSHYNRMRILQRISHQSRLLILLLCLLSLQMSTVQAQAQGAFVEPNDHIREFMKTGLAEEDLVAMQAEVAWGAREMNRYKSLRGDWPIREGQTPSEVEEDNPFASASSGDDADRLFRGRRSNRRSAPHLATGNPHEDYWNYLVSMF